MTVFMSSTFVLLLGTIVSSLPDETTSAVFPKAIYQQETRQTLKTQNLS